MNLLALLMSPRHAEFMTEHTYGRISWITSSTNKRKKNTGRRKRRSLKNRKKLESTPCLIQITRRHQLSKSKTTLTMMRTMSSQKIKQCATLVEVLRWQALKTTGEYILCLMTRYRKTSECNKFYLFKSAIESNKSNHFLVNHGKLTRSLVTLWHRTIWSE